MYNQEARAPRQDHNRGLGNEARVPIFRGRLLDPIEMSLADNEGAIVL
jgi:hypothetical protein